MTSAPGSLTELQAHYEQSRSGDTLALTADNAVVPGLAGLLASVPAGRVTLTGRPDIRLDGGTLIVDGAVDERWPAGGVGTREVRLTHLRLVVSGETAFTVSAQLTGTVTIGGAAVAVQGTVDDDGQVVLDLVAGQNRTVPLVTLADYVSDGKLGAFIPSAGTLFDGVPLSLLRLSFAFGRSVAGAASAVTAGSVLEQGTWPLVTKLADLDGIRVELHGEVDHLHGRVVERTGGRILAGLRLDEIDLGVVLGLRGPNAWMLEIVPGDGNVLPGLDALAELAGATGPGVQAELAKVGVGALAVDGVSIGVDPAEHSIGQVAVAGHVTIDDITFDLQVALPGPTFIGSLSPATPIHLKALVSRYFPAADHFPAVDLTSLDNDAIPGTGHYGLAATIDSDWVLNVGPVPIGFKEFSLAITKDKAGVTGSVDGVFSLFDATFEVTAEHLDADSGWLFSADTLPGQRLTVAGIHARIADTFGVHTVLPAALEGLDIENLHVRLDTGVGNFQFSCEARFPMDDRTVDIVVTITLDKLATGGYRKSFGGHITVGALVFDLHFVQDTTSALFVATYSHTGPQRLKVADLVAEISAEAASFVPDDLEIDLKDVLLAIDKGTTTGFLLGLDLGVDIGLSQLPLIGKEFSADQRIGIDSLRLLVASRPMTTTEVGAMNALLPASVPQLPAAAAAPDASQQQGTQQQGTQQQGTQQQGTQQQSGAAAVALTKGVTVSARLLLGSGSAQTLSVPAGATTTTTTGGSPTQVATTGPPPVAATAPDNTRWFDVQRAFGPVYVDRIGFEYRERTIKFLLGAALTAAGVTLSLDGLTFGSPIDRFAPSFDLRGLGIDYKQGPVEIGGALLRSTVVPAGGGAPYDEYDGAAVIRTEELSLVALGSYAYLDGQPSMFVYAVLDAALGGPAFLFVTGLAAGFGYNRRIVVPPVERVADFPLITAAANPQPTAGASNPKDLLQSTLGTLRAVVPPDPGNLFLAFGVKFQSFRIIDSFVLVVASFGDRFELDVLGLSTLVAPTPDVASAVPPLAEIQLAVKASFVPDEGFLGISGRLTTASFVFSRDCHLTGGFAAYTWFSGKHAGDFAITFGGYHPAMRVPDHYPQAPRLGFNWQVDANLAAKGELYCALTPVALMAGGHLEVVWQDGNKRAAFVAGADFIVAWQPYHYDAHLYVGVNASYTFHLFGTHHISVDVGADLHVWGPEFAGTAHVKLSVISFDVTFGHQGRPAPAPIDWATFRRAFLPGKGLTAIAVAAGSVRNGTGSPGDLGAVDPQRVVLRVDAVIPCTGAHVVGDLAVGTLRYTGDAAQRAFLAFEAANEGDVPAQGPSDLSVASGAVAVGSMGIAAAGHAGTHLRSTLTITVTLDGSPAEHHFGFVPVVKDTPAGMWGELGPELRPDPNAPTLVRDSLTGFEIRPRLAPDVGTDPAAVDGAELLQYHRPALPGGRYHVAIRQQVSTDEPGGAKKIPTQSFDMTGDFTVAGVRQVLDPQEVYAVYPPDGATGTYSSDLPHVVLSHSTLPWQDRADPAREDLPWLALVIFGPDELPVPQVVTLGELRKPARTDGTVVPVFPADSLDDTQPDGDKVTVIDVPADRLSRLLPPQDASRRDLALLAHVRRATDGTERAVIIGNRLALAGVHVAHLVSVRHRYGPSGFVTSGAAGTAPIRLVSLLSWRFTSTGVEQDLAALLRRLAAGSAPLRRPDGPADGGLRLTYRTARGATEQRSYRGPLVPRPDRTRAALPVRAAADLDQTPGFAEAWQLGRMLALCSKPFAASLYRWKRRRAKRTKQGDVTSEPIPAAVLSWLEDAAVLRGIPFTYLVPDEALLPVDALRFFSVASGWLACLLDGALSIGRITPSDFDADRTLAAELSAAPGVSAWVRGLLAPDGPDAAQAVSGVLLRSAVVSGWPDLVAAGTDAAGNAMDLARSDLLSSNTLLWLGHGELATFSLRQHLHTVHFDLGADAVPLQQGDGVVDVTGVATARTSAGAAMRGASAQFAARVLAVPAAVDVPRVS